MQTVFGEMVKRYRNHLGMTQKDLGEKLNISAQAVSGWEQNGKYPEVKLLPKLQRTLKIPYRVFMAGLEAQDVDSGVIEDHACKYCGKSFQVDDARRDFEGYYQRDGYKFLEGDLFLGLREVGFKILAGDRGVVVFEEEVVSQVVSVFHGMYLRLLCSPLGSVLITLNGEFSKYYRPDFRS